MTWFEQLTGIKEESPEYVRSQLSLDGDDLICPNGSRLAFGQLEIPSLGELRNQLVKLNVTPGELKVTEVVADVRQLHANSANQDALFQVASQFNLLEMVSPAITPEAGVGIYERDLTQGPACAIACGAGTIYRNYFVPVGDAVGQTANRQIDCSADLGAKLGNQGEMLWRIENGYLFPTDEGLDRIDTKLRSSSQEDRNAYRDSLSIGLQWNAAVTLPNACHRVSQAYCSALPVAYGRQRTDQWTEFARLVLEAAYEATFCAAIINAVRTGSNKLFLTLLGGGAFGNRDPWIIDAIVRAVERYRQYDLDVAIVSHGSSKRSVTDLIDRIQ